MIANPTEQTVLRVAVIGGGLNSAVGYAHYNALRLDGLYNITAGVFSRHPDINKKSAAAYGISPAHVYEDYHSMIEGEREQIDAVIVLTPTSDHVGPVVAALDAGLPVICEKALASHTEEYRLIREVVNRQRGFLAVTYNYTGYPALRELRALIRSGTLGEIRHIRAEMPQEGYLRIGPNGKPMRPQEWRLHDGPIPTIYLDLGVHLHQIVHYLTGLRPDQAYATQRSYGHFGVVDYVDAQVNYENNVHCSFYFGKCMLGYRNGLAVRIYGSEGTAEWQQTEPETLVLSFADGRREWRDRGAGGLVWSQSRYTRFKAGHPAGYIEAFANLYADIHASLLEFRTKGCWRSDEVFGVDLAGEGLCLMQAFADSALRGHPIALSRE